MTELSAGNGTTIAQKTSVWSVLALILGLLSLPACGCLAAPGIICGIGAIGCWFMARRANQSVAYSNASRTMATVGLVVGSIGLLLSFIYFVALALGIGAQLTTQV